jgi:hypothetical protein
MMIEALKKLHTKFPAVTKLEVIGKSDENRAIYCMTVNNPKTGDVLSKPGIYVDGNIHGNEIQATEVCLYLLNYLLHNYNKLDQITKLVDKKVFYVIPSVNVDGKYHFFNDANTPSSNRGLRRPKDDDRDGLFDEDYPDDLDEDGNICQMRKKVKNGNYKLAPKDPRIMRRVKPGEKGEWILLGFEGIDNDGDGRINEDSEGYVDPNRNWGYDWAPEYVQSGSGDYPFSGVGIKSVAEFITAHPNITMGWAFHNSGGLIVRGPSTKAQGEYDRGDLAVYDTLGKQSERIIPGYKYIIAWKDMYSTHGDFTEWLMGCNGVYAFVGELFQRDRETFTTREEEEKNSKVKKEVNFFGSSDISENLKFNDHLAHGSLYKNWKKYKHPLYGDIEIGGFIKFSTRLPHPFMLEDMVHRNASAVIYSAKQTPEIKMEIFEKKKIQSGLYKIRIRLENSKAIPTMTFKAKRDKLYPQDILKIKGKDIKILAGGKLLNKYRDQVSYKKYRPEIQFLVVPGYGKVEFQFILSGKGPIKITYNSRHGGLITKTIQLK